MALAACWRLWRRLLYFTLKGQIYHVHNFGQLCEFHGTSSSASVSCVAASWQPS